MTGRGNGRLARSGREVHWLPAALRAAGYTNAALQRVLHAASPDDVGVLNHAPALARATAERSAAAAMIRLFFLEAAETWASTARVLTQRRCDALVAAGMLRRRGEVVRARIRVDPVGALYVGADRRFRATDRDALGLPAGDPVYPPSSDSLLLRDVIAPGAARDALDLCTGSGVQALQLARTVARVVAVDITPRAAAMTRFNAQLNGLGHLEARVGDLYAPVRGEQFDLVVANPPFVVSPYVSGPSYHAGGPTGARVLQRMLAGLAGHLRPIGRAFAVSHVALRSGETIESVARRWFRDFPGRALVLVLESGGPIDLAAAQSLFALDRGLRAYAAEVRRWLASLRRHRVRSVSLVLVAAERRGRRHLEVVDARPRVLPVPLTPAPAQRIAAWLA